MEIYNPTDFGQCLQYLGGGILNTYLKGQGAGLPPAFEALRLDDVGVYIGQRTRAWNTNLAITGVGYRASLVIPMAIVDGGGNDRVFSIGFDNGTIGMCMARQGVEPSDVYIHQANSIYINPAGVDRVEGKILSMDADGFTWIWVQNAGPVNIQYIFVCLP